MKLSLLLRDLLDKKTLYANDREVKGITLDSRHIRSGFVFIAVAGALQHGLVFATQAKQQGAIAVIYEPLGSEKFDHHLDDPDFFSVNDLQSKLGLIADRFYQSPSQKLAVIGITGTNGKTSCSQFLLQLLPQCGVIGTLGWGDMNGLTPTVNTTPDVVTVQHILADFVEAQKHAVIMEVSSHGLVQGRLNQVSFKGAVLTNLSQDHLDYHGSMAEYCQAKLQLFRHSELEFIVVNTDDERAGQFLAAASLHVKRWAFSAKGQQIPLVENVIAKQVVFSLDGVVCMICWRHQSLMLKSSLVGVFNLDNLLAVISVLLAQGIDFFEAIARVNTLQPIVGRMQKLGGGCHQPFIFIDYAHTPDALDNVLSSLSQYCHKKLIVVFGCGGNRDTGKRPKMGLIAEQWADLVIVTNDNPRFEPPQQIMTEIMKDCVTDKWLVIEERDQAIQYALQTAVAGDCIVIAGKGHEDYQEISGVKVPFSDTSIVQHVLLAKENRDATVIN